MCASFFGFVSLALMIHIASIPLLMTDTFVATLTSSGLDLERKKADKGRAIRGRKCVTKNISMCS